MFGADSSTERFPHAHQVIPTQLRENSRRVHKRGSQSASNLWPDQFVTPEEREFGWSSSLSGIRGLSEQQVRRIMYFERSLKQRLEMDDSEDSRDDALEVASGIHHRNLRSVPAYQEDNVYDPSTSGVTTTRAYPSLIPTSNRLGPCTLKTRQSVPEYQRLTCLKLNRSLRISRGQSSFPRFRCLRRLTSQESNWSSESDETSHLMTGREVSDPETSPEVPRWKPAKPCAGKLNRSINHKRNTEEKGLRGLIEKISRALASPNTASDLKKVDPVDSSPENFHWTLCHLSHDMVGAASPFPMRPPLN